MITCTTYRHLDQVAITGYSPVVPKFPPILVQFQIEQVPLESRVTYAEETGSG